MSRLTLHYLRFVGARVAAAEVEFSDRLTLVLGPSDTGKSFIVGALDFMFGAKTLPEIPELGGYSRVLLGISRGDEALTLARDVDGGRFTVHEGLVRTEPEEPPEQTLSASHSGTSDQNISSFLLEAVDLNGREVQKNQRGETDSLSFRDVARLTIVDETKMQATTPPALSGTYTTASKETSVLRLLLQDEDDSSSGTPAPKPKSKAAAKAQIEVYDRLLAQLEAEIAEMPSQSELESQHERLVASLADATSSMELLRSERDDHARSRIQLQQRVESGQAELAESGELLARFSLLQRQYESDLRRLDALAEAGSLLGYFERGPCPFCGAEEEHQHLNEACEGDETFLAASIDAERERTAALLEDLLATIGELTSRRSEIDGALPELRLAVERAEQQILALEERMAPIGGDLTEIIEARSSVDRQRELVRRHADLETARAGLLDAAASDTAKVSSKMQHAVLAEFSSEIRDRLAAWGVPEIEDVRYDRSEQDIFQGNQFRAAHGKGLRSVLHAAFTAGLAKFCLERDLPHPGFIVLDSPIVTYRPPDFVGAEGEGVVPAEFASAFYADLLTQVPGQVIVMENVEPPIPLTDERVRLQTFSKASGSGRYGFFPVVDDEAEETVSQEDQPGE